ncbi:MAG: archaeosortase/exosortase family protein, partial [Methanosarcinales archaeon]
MDFKTIVYKIKEYREPLKLILLFLFFWSFLYSLVWYFPNPFAFLNKYTADLLGTSLNLLGLENKVQGNNVHLNGFTMEIVDECTAIFVIILYSSFVLAYPTSLKNKAIGLIFGIPSLYGINLVRLIVISFFGVSNPDLFEYIHIYLWHTIILFVVVIGCLLWMKIVVMNKLGYISEFFVRFFVFSTILFLIWLPLSRDYELIMRYASKFILEILGYSVGDPSYNLSNIEPVNFNIIAFIALVLATKTNYKKIKKIKVILIGLPIMSGVHLVFLVSNVLTQLPQSILMQKITITSELINRYVLPFVLWFALIYRDILGIKKKYTCPICGKKRIGILDHIKAVH